jgi:hypothetical protein
MQPSNFICLAWTIFYLIPISWPWVLLFSGFKGHFFLSPNPARFLNGDFLLARLSPPHCWTLVGQCPPGLVLLQNLHKLSTSQPHWPLKVEKKYWYPLTSPHGIMTQKTNINVTSCVFESNSEMGVCVLALLFIYNLRLSTVMCQSGQQSTNLACLIYLTNAIHLKV